MATKSSLPRVFLILAILAVLGGGLWWLLSRKNQETRYEISTAPITRGEVTMVVTASGTLQAVTSVEVSSQISGLIKAVLVDYNTAVKQGDVLARIDPATYEQRLRQSEADFASAKANAQLARVSNQRTAGLHAKGLASDQDMDQSKAQLAQAEAQLLTKQASVEDARVNLSRCTIYAPIDGIVMDRAADVGKTVAASLNAPTLFIIANDLSKMQIVAAVAEADVGNVSEGQDTTFTVDAYPGRNFNGKVSQIRNNPKTSSNVVTYETIIDVRNEDLRLKPGMTANVSVIVAKRGNALRVPNSALRARIPEALLVPLAPEAPALEKSGAPKSPEAPAKVVSQEERRRIMREIFQQLGYSRENGPPTGELLRQIQELAKQKGVEFDPARFGGGQGSRADQGTAAAPTTRTVYRPLPAEKSGEQKIAALQIKLGITDGINTEVISGLEENDVVVLSALPATGGASTAANRSNPFGPPSMPRR